MDEKLKDLMELMKPMESSNATLEGMEVIAKFCISHNFADEMIEFIKTKHPTKFWECLELLEDNFAENDDKIEEDEDED